MNALPLRHSKCERYLLSTSFHHPETEPVHRFKTKSCVNIDRWMNAYKRKSWCYWHYERHECFLKLWLNFFLYQLSFETPAHQCLKFDKTSVWEKRTKVYIFFRHLATVAGEHCATAPFHSNYIFRFWDAGNIRGQLKKREALCYSSCKIDNSYMQVLKEASDTSKCTHVIILKPLRVGSP